jgi:hypothetical protein
LFFGRGAVPHQKPKPSSSDTVRSRQNVIHRIRLGFLSILSLVSGRSGAKNGSGIES